MSASRTSAVLTVLALVAVATWLAWSSVRRSNVNPRDPNPRQEVESTPIEAHGSPGDDANPEPEPIERGVVEAPSQPLDPERATVRGRVVDERDRPIAGADVVLSNRLFPVYRRSHRTTTADDGSFEFRDVVAGNARCEVSSRALCDVDLNLGKLEKGEVDDLGDIVLYRGTEVDGFVRVDGKPAPGLSLFIVRTLEGRALPSGAAIPSGREGYFKVPQRLPPGTYRVLAMPMVGVGPLAVRSRAKLVAAEFTLVAGQPRYTVQIDLQGRE